MKKPYTLARRIIIQFCIFSVILSLVFSCYNFIFLYTLEDSFIEKGIRSEAELLKDNFKASGKWGTPQKENLTIHHSIQTFPDSIKEKFDREPNTREFYGDNGLHYHMTRLAKEPNVYLIAEVSKDLFVRPIRLYIINFLLISTVIMALIACFIGYRLSKKMIHPLTKLVDLVHGVSPQDLPKGFAKDFPNNEIGILASNLETSMETINDFVNRELHFTRDASHELRTPIAIIKNASELLADDKLTAEESRTLVQRINRATLQMEQSVNTLLSLAREENASSKAQMIKLLPIVEKAVIQHAYILTNKPVEVDVDIGMNDQLLSQPGILQILTANLVSNAFQYTTHGTVKISFSDNKLSVFNTSEGIEEKIKDSVLEPLIKGENSQGYGLGLSIVKRLCEHHKLGLKIENHEDGIRIVVSF